MIITRGLSLAFEDPDEHFLLREEDAPLLLGLINAITRQGLYELCLPLRWLPFPYHWEKLLAGLDARHLKAAGEPGKLDEALFSAKPAWAVDTLIAMVREMREEEAS